MKSILFSGFFISINNSPIDLRQFTEHIPDGTYQETYNNAYYVYIISTDGGYKKIYFTHGNPNPRPDVVINIHTGQEEDNPRQHNQYEPKQEFAVLDFNTSYLWLSNMKKQTALISFIRTRLNNANINIKEVYSEEDFIQTISRIDEIRFSAVPDIFSNINTLTEAMTQEIYGYESAIASIQLKYDSHPISKGLLAKISNLFGMRQYLKNIMISGRDKNGVGMLFNTELFSRKIEIKVNVNPNGIVNDEEVLNRLTHEISRNENNR